MPEQDAQQHRPLTEGVDYYIENGRWVFTRDYHLRRGSCCKSGCRHCPYPEQAPQSQVGSPAAKTSQ